MLTDAKSAATTCPFNSNLVCVIAFQWGTLWPCISGAIKNMSFKMKHLDTLIKVELSTFKMISFLGFTRLMDFDIKYCTYCKTPTTMSKRKVPWESIFGHIDLRIFDYQFFSKLLSKFFIFNLIVISNNLKNWPAFTLHWTGGANIKHVCFGTAVYQQSISHMGQIDAHNSKAVPKSMKEKKT